MSTISIASLIADGLYEWDKTMPVDKFGREYLRRTEKGHRVMASWSREQLQALTNLFELASYPPQAGNA